MKIPFNQVTLTGDEITNLAEAVESRSLTGGGSFSKKCEEYLVKRLAAEKALMVPSCTAALEMMGLLLNLKPGDEVILPSYTFVSTANAFALRGCTPVFVDVDERTYNISPSEIENAITPQTRAVVMVHYGGVTSDIDAILEIGQKNQITVLEDAAQALCAQYKDNECGSFGALSAFSFHSTKNIVCGEGGALVINDPAFGSRAEIIREKGTNRSQFLRGQVDKYSWTDIGSSYLLSELDAAFLITQLEAAERLTTERITIWNRYHEAFSDLEEKGVLVRPFVPDYNRQNAHIYGIRLESFELREKLRNHLKTQEIESTFHYQPLHTSEVGKKLGRAVGALKNTQMVSDCLLRLPISNSLAESDQDRVIEAVRGFF